MNKNTKIIIYAVVAAVVVYMAYRAYKFSSNPFGSTSESGEEPRTTVTLDEIMSKGYDESEARQILAAIEAGKSVSF